MDVLAIPQIDRKGTARKVKKFLNMIIQASVDGQATIQRESKLL